MEPPIQTEYWRSGGATILTRTEFGASVSISLWTRSAMLSRVSKGGGRNMVDVREMIEMRMQNATSVAGRNRCDHCLSP
jgi:hypothetical protein